MATTTKKLIVHSGATDRGAILTAYLQFKETTNEDTFQTTISDFGFYISYKSTSGGHTIGPWSSGANSILNFKGIEYKFNATIPKTLGEGTHQLAKINIGPFTYPQPDNGVFEYYISVKWTANSSWGNVNNPSNNFTFSSYIEPAPKIISAPTSFTTGGAVTIKFTRPSSFKNTAFQVCIAVNHNNTWLSEPDYGGTGYQTVDNSATSYTFSAELTKKIETGFPSTATERTVRFYLKWEGVSDKPHASATAKLGTYSYQIPDSAISVSPIGNIQQQFTGSANIYILNAENAKIKVTFDSSKITLPANGTISTYEILQGGKVVASSRNSTIQNIILTNSKIGFRIKDSRGIYTTLTEKQLNVINYTPLTFEVTSGGYKDVSDSTNDENQTDTKSLLLTFSGECFWSQFSSNNYAALHLRVDYTDAEGNSQYATKNIVRNSEGKSSYITTKNGKNYYNYTFTIDNLSPTTKNTVTCGISMRYTNSSGGNISAGSLLLESLNKSNMQIQEETPVFDYDDTSFRFNVPVEFFGGSKLLWKCTSPSGGWFMNQYQTITLPNFFDMPNGMVLIFSQFDPDKIREDGGTGQVVEWNFQSFFISKHSVDVLNERMHCFLLTTHGLTRLGTKGLKFTKTTDGKGIIITGREDNGTNSNGTGGLICDNRAFVLRYIYGT